MPIHLQCRTVHNCKQSSERKLPIVVPEEVVEQIDSVLLSESRRAQASAPVPDARARGAPLARKTLGSYRSFGNFKAVNSLELHSRRCGRSSPGCLRPNDGILPAVQLKHQLSVDLHHIVLCVCQHEVLVIDDCLFETCGRLDRLSPSGIGSCFPVASTNDRKAVQPSGAVSNNA